MRQRLAIMTVIALIQASAFADGAAVQFRIPSGELNVTLFASPRPIAAGVIELSLLVQDKNGTELALGTDASMVLRGPSGSTVSASVIRRPARLYEASVAFDRPGKWEVTVKLERNGEQYAIGGNIDVAPRPSKASSYAGYFAFPPIAVVLFVVRETLLHRRSKG
jgi:hypothetical protein